MVVVTAIMVFVFLKFDITEIELLSDVLDNRKEVSQVEYDSSSESDTKPDKIVYYSEQVSNKPYNEYNKTTNEYYIINKKYNKYNISNNQSVKKETIVEIDSNYDNDKTTTSYEKMSCKELYLKKLAELDEEQRQVYNQNVGMTQININTGELYEKWDAMLNEIYGVLKEQLSTSEMDALRTKQRAWIKYRDKKAEEARAEYEGGTIAPTMYNDSRIHTTRERCYELVNKYMK